MQWADYFDQQGIHYAFYSAANAAAIQQARRDAAEAAARALEEAESPDEEESSDDEEAPEDSASEVESEEEDKYFSAEEDTEEGQDPRAKVLSVVELEELFHKYAPELSGMQCCSTTVDVSHFCIEFPDVSGKPPSKLSVGLVGYPNVGKSSTINSLLGEKKVSVSSTPGKTKHFQTIHLSESIVLCDCPGLVFPQFATTKADLVCDGVLPIDQLREYTGPISLLAKRLPQEILEATYGLTIKVRGPEEGGDGTVTAENFLISYASASFVFTIRLYLITNFQSVVARGYTRSGQGNPDEARSARYILKDYVNGKLLFCHPPPGISESQFNKPTHDNALLRAAGKKRAPVTRVGKDSDTFVPSNIVSQPSEDGSKPVVQGLGQKSRNVDKEFFERNSALSAKPTQGGSGKEFSRLKSYPHQNAVANDGTPISLNQARLIAVLQNQEGGGKKHKKTKRVKQRSGRGYD